MDPPSKAASIVDMYALPLCALNCTTFTWKCLLGFNTDLIIMSLVICLGTTLPGNDRNSGKGRNMAALPSLYWFPVGRFRHIGAIRAGSEKLQKMVKRIPSFFTQYRCRNSTFP